MGIDQNSICVVGQPNGLEAQRIQNNDMTRAVMQDQGSATADLIQLEARQVASLGQ